MELYGREEEIPNQYVLNVNPNERNDDSHVTCNVQTGTNMQGDTASSADKSTEGEDQEGRNEAVEATGPGVADQLTGANDYACQEP
jgi:hypothetical protein